MSSVPRKVSESGYYHVVTRGTGRQIVFEEDSDRYAFLRTVRKVFGDAGLLLIAWCLMSNHVHLVVFDEKQQLSMAMRNVLSAYARRFNARGAHTGHVFQQPFSSSPIEDDAYMLAAVRYVHDNPAKAGICAAEDYPWSSYHEYVGTPEFAETALVLEMLGGVEGFKEFSSRVPPALSLCPQMHGRFTEDELLVNARYVLGGIDPSEVKTLQKTQRNELLGRLRSAGFSIRQIERLTGVGRNIIARVK